MPKDYNLGVEYPTERHSKAEHFIRRLHHTLTGTLPGTEAQRKMAPLRHPMPEVAADSVRQSAVLALLHQHADLPHITNALSLVFTLRPDSLRHHPGQISFPGGGYEPRDDSLGTTALRETSEELGIPTNGVRILGELTPLYIAPSRNLVHPFVGWISHLPPVNPDPVEVSAIVDVPLGYLLDPTHLGNHTWHRDGQRLSAPCYVVPPPVTEELHPADSEVHIWGATAMILSELLAIIRPLVSDA
jgi:8-oxo-dGTP pyrophosphatase MutT (NUDIX family)